MRCLEILVLPGLALSGTLRLDAVALRGVDENAGGAAVGALDTKAAYLAAVDALRNYGLATGTDIVGIACSRAFEDGCLAGVDKNKVEGD